MSYVDYRDPNTPRPAPLPVPYVPVQPQPQPQPYPYPQPVTPAADSSYRWNAGVVGFIVLFLLVQVSIFAYREWKPTPGPEPGPGPTPPPIPAPIDPLGVKLGKRYAPVLVSTNADAWDAAAAVLRAGKEMEDAQKALQETWYNGRVAKFNELLKPAIVDILPEGKELDPSTRAAMISLFTGIAQGVRGFK